MKFYNLSNDHWHQVSRLKPNYKKISSWRFLDVLIKVIPSPFHNLLEDWLTNLTMLRFIQQRTELTCAVFQLQIEQEYWNYIADLIKMPLVIWLVEVSQNFTRQNSLNWDHSKTKRNVEHRQKIIQSRLRLAERNVHIHLQQPYPFHDEIKNETLEAKFIEVISKAIDTIVGISLRYFRINFEQKRTLLQFDIGDAHLVKSFYDLNPTEEQVIICYCICLNCTFLLFSSYSRFLMHRRFGKIK